MKRLIFTFQTGASYIIRYRTNPNIAKQKSAVPAPIPVIALAATSSFLEIHNEVIETRIRMIAKIYKAASAKMGFSQKKCMPTTKATHGATYAAFFTFYQN
ncbi:hypothetical protein RWE15_05735 [Virgibacillus halophilus]|uniref:Uncharacterized protein n=1 Tax=Tigheibacillus halophilus TaxID=361280 RepID=A0ABU5C4C2_9BACI|nr:hypothetical protein [Virgibacillus halophilus]